MRQLKIHAAAESYLYCLLTRMATACSPGQKQPVLEVLWLLPRQLQPVFQQHSHSLQLGCLSVWAG